MKLLAATLCGWLFVTAAQGQIIQPNSLMTIINGGSGGVTPVPTSMPPGGVGNIEFAPTNPNPIRVVLRPDLTASIFVDVITDDNKPTANVQFYLTSMPCKASVVTLPAALGLQKATSRSIPIEVTGCSGIKAKGFIGILGSSGNNKEIRIELERAKPTRLTYALYISLGLALFIAAYSAVIVTKHGHTLSDAIGGATWDFGSSWASNITAFGIAFSFLIQLSIFPDKPVFGTRTEYSFLAFFAGALVAVAPGVQRMLGRTDIDNSSGAPVLTTHGVVGGFLAASAFTMWGAYLQIAAAILIVAELDRTATITRPMALPVGISVFLVGIGLALYCWRTILSTIAANASRSGTPAKAPMVVFQAPAIPAAAAILGKVPVL